MKNSFSMSINENECPDECEEDDLFYFETDHVALKGNKDYSELLKTLLILQEQRKQAIKDHITVTRIKNECLNNPLEFVQKVQAKSLEIPKMQCIVEAPKINWEKYKISIPEQYLQDDFNVKQETAKKTHREHWTLEEQRKLEQLLVKYPQETIELQRYKKIAKDLGTRTEIQVASRLQKYYLKLHEAGLPVPGRIPKIVKGRKKWKYYRKPSRHSTFFPEFHVPVTMDESEPVAGPSSAPTIEEASSNYLITTNYHESNELQATVTETDGKLIQLEVLRKVKQIKLETHNSYYHYGYKCDYCTDEPIEGTRWHCTTCVTSSIDYCNDCMLSQMYSDNPHNIQHNFDILQNDTDKETLLESDSESYYSNKNQDESNSDDMSDSECDIKQEPDDAAENSN